MNCDEVEELIGAYVLGALPSESLADIGEHLATCDNHPDAAELRTVASSLALAAPEREPPATLKARLMDAARQEGAPRESSEERRGLLGWLQGLTVRPVFSYSLAGGLALAIAALVLTNLPGGDDRRVAAFAGPGCSGGRLELRQDIAVLNVEGLATLGENQVYQLWGIQRAQPASLGLLGTASSGEVLTAVRADRSGFDQMALTVEPAGGSDSPTTQPICAADIPDAG